MCVANLRVSRSTVTADNADLEQMLGGVLHFGEGTGMLLMSMSPAQLLGNQSCGQWVLWAMGIYLGCKRHDPTGKKRKENTTHARNGWAMGPLGNGLLPWVQVASFKQLHWPTCLLFSCALI
eukprot:scaffold268808_cov19-Tisochrysis_lutea.AAC.1